MGRKLNSSGLRLGYNANWLNTNIKHNYDRVLQNCLYINNFMSSTLKRSASIKKKASARILRSTNNLTKVATVSSFSRLKLKQYVFKKISWKHRAYNYNASLFNTLIPKKKVTWIIENLNYFKWSCKSYKFYKLFNINLPFFKKKGKGEYLVNRGVCDNTKLNQNNSFLYYQDSLSKKIKNNIFFKKYYKYTYKCLISLNRLIKDSSVFASHINRVKTGITYNFGSKVVQNLFGWGKLKPLRGRARDQLYHFTIRKQKKVLTNLNIFLNTKTKLWQERYHITSNYYKNKNYVITPKLLHPHKVKMYLNLLDLKRRLGSIYYKRFFENKFQRDLSSPVIFKLKNYNLGDEVALLWWKLIVLKKTPKFSQQWLRIPGGYKVFKIYLSSLYFKNPNLLGEYLVKGLTKSRNPAQFLKKFEGTLNGFVTWWLVYGVKFFGKVFTKRYLDTLKPELRDLLIRSPFLKGDFVYNITIAIKGRWSNKKEETKQKWIIVGEKTDFQTIDSKINFYQTTAVTRRGSFGIKIWFSFI